ncbi:TPA: HK97-gp10 family putative phage morphogenesis protein [Proteus mirabilis]|uniref:HK97-gp10 family putative phage morphogenesis protein n=1 Tax=Proteus mirabilis TaxID=584 RepID=UPI0032DA4CA6
MMGEIKISGLPEIQRKMQDVARKVRKRSARKAMNAGASTLKKEIKNRVPILKEEVPHRRKGTIKRNIRSKTKVRRNGQIKTRIWVKSLPGKKITAFKQATGKNAALNPNDPFYWWFVEFGTSKMPAQPFMRPGFEAKKETTAKVIVQTLKEEIEKTR